MSFELTVELSDVVIDDGIDGAVKTGDVTFAGRITLGLAGRRRRPTTTR